jgi:hypothetical protein
MKLLFDDDLVEGAVQLLASSKRTGIPALQIRRFHVERERCYRVLDPDERATAFARLHLSWFSEWALETMLEQIVARFPGLDRALTALAFRKARGRHDEAAELYGDPEGRWRGIVAMRSDRFIDTLALTRFLHHELAHLADMLDPAFGYSSELAETGQTSSQLRLTRERYRLLWGVSIDARLIQRGLETVADETQRRRDFDRAFAFLPSSRRVGLFGDLWHGRLAKHDQLLEIASDPRGLHGSDAPVPGASCPLCGFATFQWTLTDTLRAEAIERIRSDFHLWRDGDSICARCAEMYDAITGTTYPATVCL